MCTVISIKNLHKTDILLKVTLLEPDDCTPPKCDELSVANLSSMCVMGQMWVHHETISSF